MTKTLDALKGALITTASSLVVALVFAYVFRIPIPFGSYIGPFTDLSTHGMPVAEVIQAVFIAWVFYGVFGGYIILSASGAITGLIIGRKYASAETRNKMIVLWAILIGIIPVFLLSILDYMIGPW